jgi:hypothetical protein
VLPAARSRICRLRRRLMTWTFSSRMTRRQSRGRCSLYLRYWYKSAHFTCVTGTKVLTLLALLVQKCKYWRCAPATAREACFENFLLYWYKSTRVQKYKCRDGGEELEQASKGRLGV